MADKLPDGFLSKPEALDKHRKPERTFQRRLAKALMIRDEGFLRHFYLVTSDGEVRKGTDVEEGEVEKLKGKGLYPVWHVEEEWFANDYDNKTAGLASGTTVKEEQARPPSAKTKDRASTDREALVAEIESLHRELEGAREHNQLISQQLSIKDEQILAANKIALESNVREKEYSSLLKELAGRIPSLGPSSRTTNQESPRAVAPESTEVPHTATALDAQVEIVEPEDVKSKTSRPSRRKATINRKSPSSRKKTASKRASQSKPSRKPKWYEMPTVRRFLSR